MRKHLTLAAALLASEAWLGIGILGGGIGLTCAITCFILAFVEERRRSQHLRAATVYATLLLATLAVISSSARLARHRATPVILAVNRFHSANGQYPDTLDDLLPAYLTTIPHAGFTRMSRDFRYDNTKPQLYFAGMFHGVFAYDFPRQSWTANE